MKRKDDIGVGGPSVRIRKKYRSPVPSDKIAGLGVAGHGWTSIPASAKKKSEIEEKKIDETNEPEKK